MSGVTFRQIVIAVALVAVSTLVAVGSAGALGEAAGGGTEHCKGLDAKPIVHADALRRETTLADLVAKLQARKDPFAMNRGQIATLQQANTAVAALDSKIQATCYPTRAALHADASMLWTNYRVYWLRVPQSHAIEAADHLEEARTRLGTVAEKLSGLVGTHPQATADLEAMNTALGSADAKLGVAPTPGQSIAAVRNLQPAVDMTADTTVLEAAHNDLLSIYQQLMTARADGLKVISDLQG